MEIDSITLICRIALRAQGDGEWGALLRFSVTRASERPFEQRSSRFRCALRVTPNFIWLAVHAS